jgi:hypothetical protein
MCFMDCGQGHGVAAGVALHALGLAGGAAGVEDVAGVGAVDPLAGHLGVHVLRARSGVVHVAAGHGRRQVGQAAVDHQHLGRLVRPGNGLVEQVLVGHGLAAAHAGVGADDDLGRGVFDAAGQAWLAKPPNTTEWMAPMRTQASMAKQASAIMGM